MANNLSAWFMWYFLIAVLLGLLVGCGEDATKYDYPFEGKVYIHYMSPTEIASWCGKPAKGCSMSSGRGTPDAICYVYINNSYSSSESWLACIKKHENRHCNGYTGEEAC